MSRTPLARRRAVTKMCKKHKQKTWNKLIAQRHCWHIVTFLNVITPNHALKEVFNFYHILDMANIDFFSVKLFQEKLKPTWRSRVRIDPTWECWDFCRAKPITFSWKEKSNSESQWEWDPMMPTNNVQLFSLLEMETERQQWWTGRTNPRAQWGPMLHTVPMEPTIQGIEHHRHIYIYAYIYVCMYVYVNK